MNYKILSNCNSSVRVVGVTTATVSSYNIVVPADAAAPFFCYDRETSTGCGSPPSVCVQNQRIDPSATSRYYKH
jgi:hypothetical protein